MRAWACRIPCADEEETHRQPVASKAQAATDVTHTCFEGWGLFARDIKKVYVVDF